jgi:hypothetical protein
MSPHHHHSGNTFSNYNPICYLNMKIMLFDFKTARTITRKKPHNTLITDDDDNKNILIIILLYNIPLGHLYFT